MLKRKDFWIGLIVGYLLVTLVPSLSFKNFLGKSA